MQHSTFLNMTTNDDVDNFIRKRVIPIYENDYEPETNFKFTHFSYRGYDAPVKYGIQVVQPRVPQR